MELENTLWEQNEVIRILSGKPGTAYQQADDENKALFRDWVKKLLQNEEVTVEFIKSDGTLRTMRCTLDTTRFDFPSTPVKTTVDGRPRAPRAQRTPSADAVASQTVWDLDANQWRSFRYDRLKNITVSIGVG
jgi:hypothetical protein